MLWFSLAIVAFFALIVWIAFQFARADRGDKPKI